ncbi:uncharacterized protein LOC116560819 [Sapajus apella]|uniref:Uncharacterized protein LOC116560819 n=1 Tax=Sapajus apella TaxID=9515 RepID=A0A6J3J1F3_SAPAP|nr:uncharacterized protein LOC116560819 [Sapajus apella]XP_032148194.1 uncharacterized protein LOC116560819 [Sapajus apella]XP_032148195.1 uncharacterized protein LOC116560819 [Sapajus apella]XP_032148196.1 uncharacterized protein LOC116560819 [Sapajus apella]
MGGARPQRVRELLSATRSLLRNPCGRYAPPSLLCLRVRPESLSLPGLISRVQSLAVLRWPLPGASRAPWRDAWRRARAGGLWEAGAQLNCKAQTDEGYLLFPSAPSLVSGNRQRGRADQETARSFGDELESSWNREKARSPQRASLASAVYVLLTLARCSCGILKDLDEGSRYFLNHNFCRHREVDRLRAFWGQNLQFTSGPRMSYKRGEISIGEVVL